MARLRLTVLGPPSVTHADTASVFPTRKALALLIYLAIEGGRHSRDKLTTLFWPDSDRAHGRAMLRYTLTTLRRSLCDSTGTQHLVVDGDAIEIDLDSGLDIDLRALEVADLGTLADAAELCRGEF